MSKAMNSIPDIIRLFLNASITTSKGGYASPIAKTGPIGPNETAFMSDEIPTALIILPHIPIKNQCLFNPF